MSPRCVRLTKILIVGSNDVNSVLHDAVDYAVIRICALVVASASLKPLVTSDLQRQSVLGTELLQLSHDAVCDDGRASGVETVHHCLD